jgi:pyrroline-5-carboxylate reductase
MPIGGTIDAIESLEGKSGRRAVDSAMRASAVR